MWDEQEPAKEALRILGRILRALVVGLIVFFLALYLDKNWIVAASASLSVAMITAFVGRRF
jgi:hypothetical protein